MLVPVQGSLSFALPTQSPPLSLAASVFPYASSTAITASNFFAQNASTSALIISGNATTTSGGGFNIASGCFSINGVCLVDTDTVDGSFSTTSADYWETQQWRWSTSSSQYFESTQWRWSTTSSDFWDSTKARWSTSSASYFLSQNQPLAFGTSSNDFWLSQYAKGFFFSTTSADYWQSQRNFFSTTSAQYFLSVNQGPAFSTTSASYFLSQNQSLGFGTSSSDYWLSQYGKGFFFSTTSADAWDATKARWSTSSWRWKSRKRHTSQPGLRDRAGRLAAVSNGPFGTIGPQKLSMISTTSARAT